MAGFLSFLKSFGLLIARLGLGGILLLHELIGADISACEAVGKNALGILLRPRSAKIPQRQSSRTPQIDPRSHESQDQEQKDEVANKGQDGKGVVLPSVRAVGYAWIHDAFLLV